MNSRLQTCIIFIVASLAIAWFYASVFPSIPAAIEFDTLYLNTSDYLCEKLSAPAGVSGLIACYIQQFYRWHAVSIAILFAFTLLTGVICRFTFKKLGVPNNGIALIPAAVTATTFITGAETSVQCLFFWGFLCIYTYLPRFRAVYVCLITLISYLVLPWTALFIWLAISAFIESMVFKTPKNCVGHLIGFAVLAVLPMTWNATIGFIPFQQRYWNNDALPLFFFIYVLPVPLLYIANRMVAKRKMLFDAAVAVCATGGSILYSATKPEYEALEAVSRMSYLADEERWEDLLGEISYEQCQQPIYLRYALLAESALGTLPQHLLNYPITSSQDFLFQHDGNKIGLNFNRLFYKNIQLPDECFHMSFEYATRCTDCFSLGALRCMTTYSIESGDTAVASKYLRILEKSSFHDEWVNERRAQLEQAGAKKANQRSTTFVGALPFIGEMALLTDEDRSNTRRMEYLLCGLLLDRQLKSFGSVLRASKLYRSGELPRPFAEAVAIISATQDPSLRGLFHYDENIDKAFFQFMQERINGGVMSQVPEQQNTYWNYFFHAPQQSNENNPY